MSASWTARRVLGMAGPAVSLSTDLSEGVVDRIRSLPTTSGAYLVGHYLAELAITTLVLLGTGLVVGWRVRAGPVDVAVAVWLLFLFGSATIWLGAVAFLVSALVLVLAVPRAYLLFRRRTRT